LSRIGLLEVVVDGITVEVDITVVVAGAMVVLDMEVVDMEAVDITAVDMEVGDIEVMDG